MKKFFLAFICLICLMGRSYANHLKGGWIQYEYLGVGSQANTSSYRITVRQYLDCSSTGGQRDANVYLGIYDAGTNQLYGGAAVVIPFSGSDRPNKTTYDPCIDPAPPVCYFIDRYEVTLNLPNNNEGYVLVVQRCCRISGIVNVSGSSNSIGVSYTNKIPGLINGNAYRNNQSPVFAQKDTAIVCYNSPFTFDFSATDADGDQLVYHFCDGLIGGNSSAGGSLPNPPTAPPYTPVNYSSPYSGTSPMGSGVTIDPLTGIISGIAPSVTGDYIVAVCADEYRNNVFIGTTKKEIHIKVANCSVSGAALKPTYITCNGTLLSFQNESTNASITSYLWDFGVTTLTTDTSTSAAPSYDYLKSGKDSGTYTVKLVVANNKGCKDSATSIVKIYPGFVPAFGIKGSCFSNPYTFSDSTVSKYGSLISWKWDLGDLTTLADTATSKDTAWKYGSVGSVNVKLVVANSKGCVDSLTRQLAVADKPSLQLAFKDTLICSSDSLLLQSNVSSGTITWTPSAGPNQARIINPNSNTPLVFPKDTTLYRVTVNDFGCVNTDSVKVNVLQYITVDAGPDTVICRTDQFTLGTVSYALSYLWTSSSGETVQNIKYPLVHPSVDTKYFVTANLGKCQAKDSVRVRLVDYPKTSVSADTTICFGNRVMLRGTTNGSSFSWSPAGSLSDPNTLNPLAAPTKTTLYILTAYDTLGCPKAGSDTLQVTVIPMVQANAGRDTLILPNTPTQLQATGGTTYSWSPGTGLSGTEIANPVVTIGLGIDSVVYRVTVSNGSCAATDDIVVRIYKNGPDIIVPSAFTPNGDGRNDLARPITVGISKLNYFSVFNRWGQAVFTTTEIGAGWDGKYQGVAQKSDTFVYMAEGVDFSGNIVFRKGTIALVR